MQHSNLPLNQSTTALKYFFLYFRDSLLIDEKTAGLIWRPAIKFENLLDFKQTKYYGNTVQYNFWIGNYENQSHLMQYGEEFQLTFPCHFPLSRFPFDSHNCSIYFGDERYSSDEVFIYSVTLLYGSSQNSPSTSEGKDNLLLDDLALPFRVTLEVLPIREKDFNYNVSQAGILIMIERESLGQLLSGYYYPTASFALLSIVSFLISPDVV